MTEQLIVLDRARVSGSKVKSLTFDALIKVVVGKAKDADNALQYLLELCAKDAWNASQERLPLGYCSGSK
jgi:hypothetical protein